VKGSILSVLTIAAFVFAVSFCLSQRILAETSADTVMEPPPVPSDFTIPESKLLSSEFASTSWGGTVTRIDAAGDAVLFLFSGLTGDSTGVKDDYPLDTIYGQIIPSHGNGDFSNFDGYVLWIRNLDAASVACSIFINTGFTGPSGNPPNTWQNDTFWQSPWTDIPPGEARTLRLDFDNTIPWNINDNPAPHTHGTDGVATTINAYDRTELSAIGFQVYGNANPEAAILVAPAAQPICTAELPADLDGDCKVTLTDLAVLALSWLECNLDPPSACW
jgi:hypothetical protein